MHGTPPAGPDALAASRTQTPTSPRCIWAVLAAAGCLSVVALGVRSPMWWAGLGFVATWLTFFLAGSAWLPIPRDATQARPRWHEPLHFVIVALVVGLGTAVLLWSLSALALKTLGGGTVALLGVAMAGALRLARRTPALGAAVAPVPVSTAAIAFGLACYILGTNETGDGQRLAFTYRWDWAMHLYWASLIRELGLPLVEWTGVRGVPYRSLYHTGMLVAAGGVEQLTATSLYQAARILGVGALTVIALAGACLTAQLRLPGWQTVLCGVAPLVWSCLSLPVDLLRHNRAGILDPYARSWPAYSAAAGSMYHNLPQLGAILVAAAALVSLDRHRRRGEFADLLLCGLLLGLSTAFKPSAVVVFGPAALLVLVVGGAHWRAVCAFAAAMVAGSSVYFLPALVARLPAGPGWTIRPEALLAPERLLDLAVLGVVLPLAAARVLELARAWRTRSWTVLDVILVALAGGLLFAALFVERGGRADHGNQIWSRCAALVLLAPSATGAVLRFVDRAIARPRADPARTAAAVLAAAMLALQLATGVLYAVRYPRLHPIHLAVDAAAALRAMTAHTPRTARLAADKSIDRGPQLPYLARRTLFPARSRPSASRDVRRWSAVTAGKWNRALARFVAGRDGVVLGSRTQHLRRHLREIGWALQIRSGPYELGRRRTR